MDLVDGTGKPLKDIKAKNQQEVVDILNEVAPKNKEQEVLLAKEVGRRVEKERKDKINEKIRTGFDGTFKANAKLRAKGDGYSQDRSLRLIASIPLEMVYVAKQMWGPDVLKNPVLFKKAFVEDETGAMCLTVDPKTI